MVVLTPLQHELTRLVAAGLHYREAAVRTGTSAESARTILSRVRRRLDARTTRELAVAIQQCEVREWDGGGRPGRSGFQRGDRVRITGGRYAGRIGVYLGVANSSQFRIQVGGGVFGLMRKFIEKNA